MKKLTIAIPTYNRSKFLVECLQSILPQITEEVDIIISDNASTDNTKEVIKEYLKYPFLRYYRNEENLGMDGNFLNCLKKSTGKYIHLMSDDDIMMPGTIEALIKCINDNNPDFIHLNSCNFKDNSKDILNFSEPRFEEKQTFITTNKELFISKVNIYITFLSSIVLKNKLVKEIKNPEQFIGTLFLQSHIALLTTEGDKRLAILNHNSIAGRGGNTGGYNLYKIWIEEYKKLLLSTGIKAGYSKKSMEKIYVKSIKREVRSFIINFRVSNIGFDLNGREVLIKNTYKYPSIWFTVYPFAYMPISLLKLIKNIKKFNIKNNIN